VQSAQPEISNGPVPPIFDGRIRGIGNNIPNLDAALRSDLDSLGGRNRIKNISPSGSFGERLAVHCSIFGSSMSALGHKRTFALQ
jgi:hypothetical protein